MCFRFFGWMAVAVLVGGGLMLAGCGGGGAEKPKKAKKAVEAPAPPPPPPSTPTTPPPPPTEPTATTPTVVETVVVGTKEEVGMTLQALTELAGMEQPYAIKLLGEVSNKRAADAAAAPPTPSVEGLPTAELDGLLGGIESMAGELGQDEALKGKFDQLRTNPKLVAYVYEHYNMAILLHVAKTKDEKVKKATIQEIMTFVAKQKPAPKEEGSGEKSE